MEVCDLRQNGWEQKHPHPKIAFSSSQLSTLKAWPLRNASVAATINFGVQVNPGPLLPCGQLWALKKACYSVVFEMHKKT
jgi:hypothetical protein